MSELRHSLVLARIDLTRTVRKHLDRSQLPALALFVILVGAGTIGGGYISYRAGSALQASVTLPEFPIVWAIRGTVALCWLVVVFVFAVRAFGTRGTAGTTGGLLASVPTRTAVTGILLAESAYALLWLGLPAVGLGCGFAIGAGVPSTVLTVSLAAVAFATSTAVVGYPAGLALRHVLTRHPFVARHKNTLIVLVATSYLVAVVTGRINDLFVQLFEPAASSPMAWYGDLALYGVSALSPDRTNAALGLVGAVVVVPLSVAVTTKLADRHWFSDPVRVESTTETTPESTAQEIGSNRFERGLERGVNRETAALIVLAYRRTVRAPFKLLYAAFPLFMLIGVVPDIIEQGEVPGYLVVFLLLAIVWAGGALFVLNPLGDQGNVLPATVLSSVSGRQFVRAHVIASLLVTLPVGVLVTAGAVLYSPLDVETGVAVVVASPIVILLGTAFAVGLGVAFPRFSAVQVTQSTEAVVPSKVAFISYSLYLAGTTIAGVTVYDESVRRGLAAVLSWLFPFGFVIGADALYYVAGVALVGLVLAPVFAYRDAIRRFDEYVLE